MKSFVKLFIALFICQNLAHPAQAITSTAFYKQNSLVAQIETAQQAITSGVFAAAGNLDLIASGAGQDSHILIQGSDIQAGQNATLNADGQVNLLAAQNTTEQHSTNQNNSASVGVGFTLGSKTGVSLTASAASARGNADGIDTIATNTHISAGHTANIQSGGDTTLQGAVIAANTVNANVGGNLNIQSTQDTSQYDAKQSSAGGGVSLCIPPFCYGASSVSVNAGKAKVNGDFASVTEQSGIQAGDGGFSVNVKGNTTLTGAAITSTQVAVDAGKNSFNGNTAEGLSRVTTSDIQNHADFQASSISLSTSGGGAGQQSGQAASTTTAAISNMAGNKAARTGDKETGIGQIFEPDKVMADVNAQTQITQSFGQQASKAVGDYADTRAKELRAQNNEEEAKKWDEGGTYRSAAHAVIGGLTGGASGAAGAGAAALSADAINKATANLSPGVKNAVGAAIAAGIGAAAGGGNVTGVTAAINEDLNNRQLHPDERQWAKDNAGKYQKYLEGKTGEKISTEEAYQRLLSAGYAVVDTAAQNTGKSDETAKQFIGATSPSNLFSATANDRNSPLLGGNPDGSYTPEQQARFGMTTPAERASVLVTKAYDYLGQDCGSNAALCKQKFESIDSAIGALNAAKVLYQDDPGSVNLIDRQIGLLKAGITQNELASGGAGSISDTYKNIAGVVLGTPSRWVAGSATAQSLELTGLTQAIKDVRIGLPSSAKNKGNVAAADINIEGLPSQMAASSDIKVAKNGVIGEGSGNFTYLELPNSIGKPVPRNTDSEYKILDNIADKLGNNPNVTGTIKIVTERPACDSCLDVAQQFRARYPNIDLQIFDNNGVALLPKGTYVTPYFDPNKVGSK